MAAYREHVSVSGLLGVAVGLGSWQLLGFTIVQSMLAGWLTAIGGILPDLDSESGRPVREMFGLTAAVAPLLLLGRVLYWTGLPNDPETVMVLFLAMYLGIKYGLAALVGAVSVHRGMFHSIPALLIAAEGTYLLYPGDSIRVKFLMGAAVSIGFFSHLLLDELYSVQWSGVRITLKKSAGSAIKLFGPGFGGNAVAYMLLAGLTIVTLTEAGVIGPADTHSRQFTSETDDAEVAAPNSATAKASNDPPPQRSAMRRSQSVDGYPTPIYPTDHRTQRELASPPSQGVLR